LPSDPVANGRNEGASDDKIKDYDVNHFTVAVQKDQEEITRKLRPVFFCRSNTAKKNYGNDDYGLALLCHSTPAK
jgi:hypothetical protein